VKSLNNSLIKIISAKERKGKIYAMRTIQKKFSSEILVFLDADIRLGDNLVLSYLVQEFTNNPKVMVVGAHSKPEKSQGFIQKAIYSKFEIFESYRIKIKDGHNIFNCTGACFCLRKQFANELIYPEILINEDDFSYLTCIYKGYKFRYAKRAFVYYKLPNNLIDYVKLTFRSNHKIVGPIFKKYFGRFAYEQTSIPLNLYFKSLVKVLRTSPAEILFISILSMIISPFIPKNKETIGLSQYTISSTK